MIDIAQRALRNYRKRVAKRGMARSEGTSAPPKKSTLAALRRAPLVRSDIDLARSREAGRKVDF